MSEETKKQLTYADAGVLTVPKLSAILAVSAVCLP